MPSVLISSTSHFPALAENRNVVDKSSAIRDFLDDDYPVHLLLRPRRSGKTTLLSMFRNLGYMPYYMWIYLNVIGRNFESLKEEFRKLLVAIVCDLETLGLLTNLHELHDKDRTFLNQILNDEQYAKVEAQSLFKLTKVLHILNKREVIVLVDEYDTPTSYATRHGYFAEADEFFRKVFSPLLKNNDHLRGALMVGILRVAKAGWFSGVNNLDVYMLGQPGKYSTACMFTEAETQLLYDKQKKILESRGSDISFTFANLRRWFNGYNSGDGERLYNPWAIAKAFNENKLDCFWIESGYDQAIMNRIYHMLDSDDQFREQYDLLVLDQPHVMIKLDQEMSYSSITEMSVNQLWALLYSAGYLKTRMVETQHPQVMDSDMATRISAQIPNLEIRTLFRRWLCNHLEDGVERHKMTSDLIDMFQNMVSGSMASFAKGFSKLIWQTMPPQFLGRKEAVYQAYVCAFFTTASRVASDRGGWVINVEQNAGIGRLDLSLYRGEEAVIQEHKLGALTQKDKTSGYGDSQRTRLTKWAEEGLAQINTRGYRARVGDQVIKLREFGIAFLGLYCVIVGHSLEREAGGQWKIKETYNAATDEEHRNRLYTVSD